MAAKKERISITLDREILARIDRIVVAMRQSRSGWIEQQIRNAIEDEELGVKVLMDPVLAPNLLGLFKDRELLQSVAKVFGEQLSDDQLRLFSERLEKVTGRKPRGKDAQKRARSRR